MEDIIQQLMDNDKLFIISVVFGAIVVMSVVKAFFGMITGLAHERTRREIAAYVAEGSMTPDQAQRILDTKKQNNSGCG
ncbi:MAG: hypothetical protein JKY96_00970 [Phycisphaerales bacterium]|nr:hypothetical protein [Phycisphaerales bacterium]